MRIFTHNFNPHSNSGPNKFTRTLFTSLINNGHANLAVSQSEADVEFCLIQQEVPKVKPMVLRLDGIWFNSEQDYKTQNAPIRYSYENSEVVVFQSEFNKKLTESWFGPHKNSCVIHNAPDLNLIERVDSKFWNNKFGKDVEVWSCASSWRPHKRLKNNVDYFLNYAPKDAVFAIAGALAMDEAKELLTKDKRIFVLGELDYISLLSLYKRSSVFVHLAYLDHCPNVVVDAQAAGCHIVCSSTGGTSEIVHNGTIIKEQDWDFKPLRLYSPPKMNYEITSKVFTAQNEEIKNNIVDCAKSYYNVFTRVTNEIKRL